MGLNLYSQDKPTSGFLVTPTYVGVVFFLSLDRLIGVFGKYYVSHGVFMSDVRYHIKRDGSVGVCKAKPGKCPLGGTHYTSEKAALEAGERMMQVREMLTTPKNSLKKMKSKDGLSGKPIHDAVTLKRMNAFDVGKDDNGLAEDSVVLSKVFSEAGIIQTDKKGYQRFVVSEESFPAMSDAFAKVYGMDGSASDRKAVKDALSGFMWSVSWEDSTYTDGMADEPQYRTDENGVHEYSFNPRSGHGDVVTTCILDGVGRRLKRQAVLNGAELPKVSPDSTLDEDLDAQATAIAEESDDFYDVPRRSMMKGMEDANVISYGKNNGVRNMGLSPDSDSVHTYAVCALDALTDNYKYDTDDVIAAEKAVSENIQRQMENNKAEDDEYYDAYERIGIPLRREALYTNAHKMSAGLIKDVIIAVRTSRMNRS